MSMLYVDSDQSLHLFVGVRVHRCVVARGLAFICSCSEIDSHLEMRRMHPIASMTTYSKGQTCDVDVVYVESRLPRGPAITVVHHNVLVLPSGGLVAELQMPM